MIFRLIASVLVLAGLVATAYLTETSSAPPAAHAAPPNADEAALKSLSTN